MSNSPDNDEETTVDTKENTAKIDVNARRRRHSFVNIDNSLLRRRLSRGEQICVLYNPITNH